MTRLQEIQRQIRNLQAEEQRIVREQMPAEAAARNAEARARRDRDQALAEEAGGPLGVS